VEALSLVQVPENTASDGKRSKDKDLNRRQGMKFRAILVPTTGEKAEQVFCESLEQAKTWARRTLWDRHRKLVQAAQSVPPYPALNAPFVALKQVTEVDAGTVTLWDVTDEDKKQETGE